MTEHAGEIAPLVEHLANALYETLFDPRCDVEGAVWDDAVSIATKVATRFEQVGHAREYVEEGVGGIAAVYDVDDQPPWEYGTSDHTVPVFRMVHSGRTGGSDGR